LNEMSTKEKIIATAGFTIVLLVIAAVWWALPDRNGDGRDSALAQEQNCIRRSLDLVDTGETELGLEWLNRCRNRPGGNAELVLKSDPEKAARDLEPLLRDWTPSLPTGQDAQAPADISPEEISGRIRIADKIINIYPQTYHARLAALAKALLLFQGGRYAECVQWISGRHRNMEMQAYALYMGALAAKRNGDGRGMAEMADKVIVKFPGTVAAAEAGLLKARVLMLNGMYEQAAAKARAVADSAAPPFLKGRALLLEADCHRESGQPGLAVKSVLEIARSYPAADAEDFLEQYLELETDEISLFDRVTLAEYFLKKQRGYPIIQLLSLTGIVSHGREGEGVHAHRQGKDGAQQLSRGRCEV